MEYDEKQQLLKKIASLKLQPSDWPTPLQNIELAPTEQRVYLQISLEFQKILDAAPSFQMGSYQWYQILPERLYAYGLTEDAWVRISEIGDNSDELQDQLAELVEKFSLEGETDE